MLPLDTLFEYTTSIEALRCTFKTEAHEARHIDATINTSWKRVAGYAPCSLSWPESGAIHVRESRRFHTHSPATLRQHTAYSRQSRWL